MRFFLFEQSPVRQHKTQETQETQGNPTLLLGFLGFPLVSLESPVSRVSLFLWLPRCSQGSCGLNHSGLFPHTPCRKRQNQPGVGAWAAPRARRALFHVACHNRQMTLRDLAACGVKLGGLGRFHAGRAASRETQAGPTHVVLRRLMHGPVTAPYVTSRRVAYARAARMTHHARKTMAKKRGQEEVSFRHRLLYLCELAAPRRHQNRRARPAEPGSRLLVRDAARARPFLPPPWGVSRAKPEKNQAYLHRVNVPFTRRA